MRVFEFDGEPALSDLRPSWVILPMCLPTQPSMYHVRTVRPVRRRVKVRSQAMLYSKSRSVLAPIGTSTGPSGASLAFPSAPRNGSPILGHDTDLIGQDSSAGGQV